MLQEEDLKNMGPMKDAMEAGYNDEGTQWLIFWETDEELWDDYFEKKSLLTRGNLLSLNSL